MAGEIKGKNASPLIQVVATMQAIKERDDHWPYGEFWYNIFDLTWTLENLPSNFKNS